MVMKQLTLPLLFSVLGATLVPHQAEAYCRIYAGEELTTWDGYQELPVFLDEGFAPRFVKPDGSPWTTLEVENEIRWTLRAINEYSGADTPRLYYAGPRPDCGGTMDVSTVGPCHEPNSVVITYQPLPGGPAGVTNPYANTAAGNVMTFNNGGPWRTGVGGPATFTGGVMHEMVHILGLSHPGDCMETCAPGQSPCSAVDTGLGNVGEGNELYLNDAEGLRDIYGIDTTPPGNVRHHLSGDPAWFFTEVFESRPNVLPGFQGSSGNSAEMFFGGRDAISLRPSAWLQPGFGAGFDPWGNAAGDEGIGAVGASWDDDLGDGTLAYTRGETATFVAKRVRALTYSVPGFSDHVTSASTTRRHGASASFDPFLGGTVVASRDDRGQVVFHARFPGEPLVGPFPVWRGDGTPAIAYETPSVTCADDFFFNCIAVWPEGNDPWHENRYIQFAITDDGTGTGFVFQNAPLISGPLVLHGAPQVTYRGPADEQTAFTMSWTLHWDGTSIPLTGMKEVLSTEGFDLGGMTTHGSFTDKIWVGLGVPDDVTTLYLGG